MDSYYTYRVQLKEISPCHRVYMANETDKEIEQYKHTLEHYVKQIKLLTAEIDKKDEEKEWLIDVIIGDVYTFAFQTEKEKRKSVIDEMQQALKEK